MVVQPSLSLCSEEQQMKSRMNASRQARTQTAIVTCPDCGEKMTLEGAIRIGLSVRCPNCEAGLMVVLATSQELYGVCQELGDDRDFLVRW